MELKHVTEIVDPETGKLLIVPYGIETIFVFQFLNLFLLLIVPYGIETKFFQKSFFCQS